MVRQRRWRHARPLQPLRPQGHAAGQRRARQRRQVLPLPVPRLDLRLDGSPLADSAQGRLRGHAAAGVRIAVRGWRRSSTWPSIATSSSCALSTPGRTSRLLRRGAARDRQPGRPLAGRAAAWSKAACLRNIIHCNWKMYLENINDTVHPLSTHESATRAAKALWEGHDRTSAKPMAMEQILPFGAGYDFFDRMGGRVYPNGHSVLGTQLQHPLRLRAAARVRGGDARGPWRGARRRRSCSARRRTRALSRAWR